MPSASESYGRLAGRQIQVDCKMFKILYRLNYLDFHFVNINAMLLIVLEVCFHKFLVSLVKGCKVCHKQLLTNIISSSRRLVRAHRG